jgi:hypothetical protein
VAEIQISSAMKSYDLSYLEAKCPLPLQILRFLVEGNNVSLRLQLETGAIHPEILIKGFVCFKKLNA